MPEKLRTFLVTTAEDQKNAAALRVPAAYLFYCIGEGGVLQRRGLPASARGGVMGIFDDGSTDWDNIDYARLSRDIVAECGRRSYGGVLMDFEENAGSLEAVRRIAPALTAKRLVHFVPLGLSAATEHAKIILPSAVSGGSYLEMLQRFTVRYPPERLCLELVRVCSDFTMPSYSSEGRSLTAAEFREILERVGPQSYFSADLCAKYFTYHGGDGQTHFLLYDDPATAAKKIEAAARLGFFAAFLLYRDWGAAAADIVADLRDGAP